MCGDSPNARPELAAEVRARQARGARQVVHVERLEVAGVGEVLGFEEVAGGRDERGHLMTAMVSPVATEPPSDTPSSSTVPARRSGDLVLHLHRLDHADQRALLDLGALLDGDLQHGPLDRRDELAGGPAAAAASSARAAAPAWPRRPAGAVRRPASPITVTSKRAAGHLHRVLARDLLGRSSSSAGCSAAGNASCFSQLPVLDQVAAGLAVRPLLGGEQRLVERDQRLQAADLVLAERAQHALGRGLAVHVPDDQLGDHRVVERAAPRSPPRRPSPRARTAPTGSR